MKIGHHNLEAGPFVIAEIGVAHEGKFDLAEMMIDQAAATGAHAVKFQTFSVSRNRYLSNSIDVERFGRTKGYEFSEDQWRSLAARAKAREILFLSTPFDLDAADLIDQLAPAFKIASGDLTFYPLLAHVAAKGKPIILSTGMATHDEIGKALKAISAASPLPLAEQVVLLHCVSAYPCPPEAVNLRAMDTLARTFGLRVGYSNHMLGSLAAELAVACGAAVIEVHFTYRKENQTFRDHTLSFDQGDLTAFMEKIAQIEIILGDGSVERAAIESDNAIMMRRSLALDVNLRCGDRIEARHITFLRPATGLGTDRLDDVVGRTLNKDMIRGTILTEGDLV